MICYKCQKEIEDKDNYCRYCGAGQGSHISWYYQMWGVWLLLFIIGPFCLWFLYKSPYKNKKVKIINAVLIMAVSFWLCYQLYVAIKTFNDLLTSMVSGTMF